MWGRWKLSGSASYNVLYIVLLLILQDNVCMSLNSEGIALMEFRLKVEHDPHGVFDSWNPMDDDPCSWWGIYCICSKVEMLNLNGLSLGGQLALDLGKLGHLKSLVLSNNNFSGPIPKELGLLTRLELLDLRSNKLSGKIPEEIKGLPSLKHLWLCNNKFEDDFPLLREADSSFSRFRYRKSLPYMNNDINNIKSLSDPYLIENGHRELRTNILRRRLLLASQNLPALPINQASITENVDVPSTASGSFPAIPSEDDGKSTSTIPGAQPDTFSSDSPVTQSPTLQPAVNASKTNSMPNGGFGIWMYVIFMAVILLVLIVVILWKCRTHSEGTISPWKTGISGQLQKAFVAGVPKLNRAELEAACEDFSNIIESYPECTVYKGTLSSGVEIAVFSTAISSFKDWSENSEIHFHKKIDMLSRINHKNFVNLIGYCEEDEPFMRMMVFEYAPNGTLFEHIHVKELEHLDWSARMRIIMGIAYCLQYIHHELNPPIVLSSLESSAIFLTDDFAAKILDMDFWKNFSGMKKSKVDDLNIPEMPSYDFPNNVFSFGILMLEMISSRPPYTKEHGSIISWAAELFKEKQSVNCLVDPALESVKKDELDAVYQVIQQCVNPDPQSRPTMKDVASKLRDALKISPESATPRISPLWWAELEILSVEAS